MLTTRHIVSIILLASVVGCASTGDLRATVIATIDKSHTGDHLALLGDHGVIVLDLNRDDGIRLGDEFAVYDAADPQGRERKAVIEVYNIKTNVTECRVRIQYEPIRQRDWCKRISQSTYQPTENRFHFGPVRFDSIEQRKTILRE